MSASPVQKEACRVCPFKLHSEFAAIGEEWKAAYLEKLSLPIVPHGCSGLVGNTKDQPDSDKQCVGMREWLLRIKA